MRRAYLLPGLAVRAAVALVLGALAALLVLLAGRVVTAIVLGLLLALFFYALLTIVRSVPVWHSYGPGNRGQGGGSAGVREPRRPRWPGFPPRAAAAEPESTERTV